MRISIFECYNCGNKMGLISMKEPLFRCHECNSRYMGYNKDEFLAEYKKIKENKSVFVSSDSITGNSGESFYSESKNERGVHLIAGDGSSINISIDGQNKSGFKESMGWLVLHTEEKDVKTYPLHKGDNLIGRNIDSDINLTEENDLTVSKFHAVLAVVLTVDGEVPSCNYYISDNNNNGSGKPSLNGTYINGNKMRLDTSVRRKLSDGDTIQIGTLKFVLKTINKAESEKEAKSQVENTNYAHTVLFQQ